jgi:hypothetical protein
MVSPAHCLRRLTPSLVRAACGQLPPNRRGEMRRSLRLGCRVRRREGKLVGDRAVDLSPGGMLVLSDERLEPGLVVVVSFQATDFSLWFDSDATVTRVVEGRRPRDPGRAVGLRFVSLPSVSRLILRGHLRTAPLVPPQRDPPRELLRRPYDYAEAVRRAMADGPRAATVPLEDPR